MDESQRDVYIYIYIEMFLGVLKSLSEWNMGTPIL